MGTDARRVPDDVKRGHRCYLFGLQVKPLAVALAVANSTVAFTYLLNADALGDSHWADARVRVSSN